MEVLRKTYTILFILVTALLSCSKEKNTIATKTVSLGGFNYIVLNDAFKVVLTSESSNSITITAANRFIDDVTYTIVGDTLLIDYEGSKRWIHPNNNEIKLTVNYTQLREVTANETCFISTSNAIPSDRFNLILKSKANQADITLNCNEFTYWNNTPCGGELKLNGTTTKLAIWNYALMKVDASELNCDTALVENYSTGDCEIKINNYLKYGIGNSGNIILHSSSPTLIQEFKTGSGEFIMQ